MNLITLDENSKPFIEVINETTGELETVPLESLPPAKRLTWLAREMRRLEKQKEQIEVTAKEELERIGGEMALSIQRLERNKDYLMTLAGMNLAELGDACPKDKKDRPVFTISGYGSFKYRSGRESVNIDAFYDLPKDKAQELIDTRPELFVVSTKYTPSREAIKKTDNRPDCFVIEKPQDKLVLD